MTKFVSALAGVALIGSLASAPAFAGSATFDFSHETTGSGVTGTFASVPSGLTVTLTGSSALELDNNSSYLDSNYAPNTNLVAVCGLGGLGSCVTPGTLSLSFSAPVTSFSIAVDDFDTSSAYTFSATVNGNSTVVASAGSIADNAQLPAVLSYTNASGISSVTISGSPDGDFVVGNLSVVPEPAAFGVLAIALGGLVFARRRV